MIASIAFIKTVFDAATNEFGKAGWRKRKPGMFSADLSADAYGLVGLNKAIGRGEGILEINPVISVGNQRVEKLVAEMMGQKFQNYATAAIGANVGYLMPEKNTGRGCFAKATTGNLWSPKWSKPLKRLAGHSSSKTHRFQHSMKRC